MALDPPFWEQHAVLIVLVNPLVKFTHLPINNLSNISLVNYIILLLLYVIHKDPDNSIQVLKFSSPHMLQNIFDSKKMCCKCLQPSYMYFLQSCCLQCTPNQYFTLSELFPDFQSVPNYVLTCTFKPNYFIFH